MRKDLLDFANDWKVFKMDEYAWMCARTKEEALRVYIEEYDADEDEKYNIRECDLDKEGMWYGFDSEELKLFLKCDEMKERKISKDPTGSWDFVIWMTFREVLKEESGNMKYPFIIACTEY